MSSHLEYEAIVIGSGFGGSVMCARLAKRWPGKVLLLERGKSYPLGSFPRSPNDIGKNFWFVPPGKANGADQNEQKKEQKATNEFLTGLLDMRHFKTIDSLTASGLGGGSLIYANVFMLPPAYVFDEKWPRHIDLHTLSGYFGVAKQVLGARQLPVAHGPNDRRYVARTEWFKAFADSEKLTALPAEITVFFGNDYTYGHTPETTDPGVQELNAYGARQTSCTYCGECNFGCNTHAKNSLDRNYLHVAEFRYNTKVQTLAMAETIVPLDADGKPDVAADGRNGYQVTYLDVTSGERRNVKAQRVVVSAGTLGTTELLLRCRDVFCTLPRLSERLGENFSGNGDFLVYALHGEREINSTYGPVVTQSIDHHLYHPHSMKHGFIIQDASFVTQIAWVVTAMQPILHPISRLLRALREIAGYLFVKSYPGRISGSVGPLIRRLIGKDTSQYGAVLLFMGIDKSNGRMSLNRDGYLTINWPRKWNRPLYHEIVEVAKRFTKFIKGRTCLPLPSWLWPVRKNVTVHPLGGCVLADTPETGVVRADWEGRGQVFGYQGLYVADGSLIPVALGANPSATIAALSEWIAEGVTGVVPTAEL